MSPIDAETAVLLIFALVAAALALALGVDADRTKGRKR